MPQYRRLRSGLNSMAQSAQDILGMLLQDKMRTSGERELQQSILDRQLLTGFQDDAKDLTNPENVQKFGPDVAKARYEWLKRRLPGRMQSLVGNTPDFTTLDKPYDQRLADLTKEISGITNPDDLSLSPEGLKKRAPSFRVPVQERIPGGLGSSAASDMPFDNPDIQALISMAEKQRTGLLEKEPRTPVTDFSSGTGKQNFYTSRELGGVSAQSERTAEQEASRQGGITQATTQATQDVMQDPRNIKGFATREQALAFARTTGGNRADTQTKTTPQVIEDKDDAGNKVFRVIDASASAIGQATTTQVPSETLTDAMRQSFDYANRATKAHNLMMQLEPVLAQRGTLVNYAMMKAPNAIQDPATRQYVQAIAESINAQARRESGAAISPDEYSRYQSTNALSPGDDATTLQQKQDSRRRVIQGLTGQAGTQQGKIFVFMSEIEALAQQAGVPVEQKIQEAEASGYRVVR